MKPSEVRKLIKTRDESKRNAQKLEKQAEGKSQFIQEHLLTKARQHRETERICNLKLSTRM